MPKIDVNGARLYYEKHGTGPETIVFAHALLWSGRMYDHQVNALKNRYRCVTFDFRGQGQSDVARSGYDMDTLSKDAAALIEALDCAPCHFVGLSMGGFVGMRLAVRRPDLIRSLVLLDTSADPEPQESARRYRLLNFIARWLGLTVVADRVMQIMFGEKFLNDPARRALKAEMRQRLIANHRIGITRAVNGVIQRPGICDALERITAPTLIMVGDQDVATPLIRAERIHARIHGSKLIHIPGAGHTSTIEEPEAVNAALEAFLGSRTDLSAAAAS
jgi:pimeloyl-ACP methyl ester carboxylesterase